MILQASKSKLLCTVKALYFVGSDFAFVTLLQCAAKMFAWYLILRKHFIHEICEINPTRNLRLLQYSIIILVIMVHRYDMNTDLQVLMVPPSPVDLSVTIALSL